jgi:hypothetical protein
MSNQGSTFSADTISGKILNYADFNLYEKMISIKNKKDLE